MSSEVLFESKDGQSLFEPLSRDKTSNVGSEFSLAWQEMSAVVEHFRQFGAKEHVRGCWHLYILVYMFVLKAVVIILTLMWFLSTCAY